MEVAFLEVFLNFQCMLKYLKANSFWVRRQDSNPRLPGNESQLAVAKCGLLGAYLKDMGLAGAPEKHFRF